MNSEKSQTYLLSHSLGFLKDHGLDLPESLEGGRRMRAK